MLLIYKNRFRSCSITHLFHLLAQLWGVHRCYQCVGGYSTERVRPLHSTHNSTTFTCMCATSSALFTRVSATQRMCMPSALNAGLVLHASFVVNSIMLVPADVKKGAIKLGPRQVNRNEDLHVQILVIELV